jgi:Tfp pilus assembly PilM family ATPase
MNNALVDPEVLAEAMKQAIAAERTNCINVVLTKAERLEAYAARVFGVEARAYQALATELRDLARRVQQLPIQVIPMKESHG